MFVNERTSCPWLVRMHSRIKKIPQLWTVLRYVCFQSNQIVPQKHNRCGCLIEVCVKGWRVVMVMAFTHVFSFALKYQEWIEGPTCSGDVKIPVETKRIQDAQRCPKRPQNSDCGHFSQRQADSERRVDSDVPSGPQSGLQLTVCHTRNRVITPLCSLFLLTSNIRSSRAQICGTPMQCLTTCLEHANHTAVKISCYIYASGWVVNITEKYSLLHVLIILT